MDNAANIAARTPGLDALTGAAAPTAQPEAAASGADFFWNLLDVINPLQHIPVISTIYRALTGDEISPAAKLAGGTLFGGPLGAAAAIASIAVEGATGSDVGELVLAQIIGDDVPAPEQQIAQVSIAAPAETPVQTAALVQPEPPRDTIIWNGVRQTPLLTNLAGPAPASNRAAAPPTNTPPAPIAATGPDRATTTNPSAAWLATALTQAESLETANAKGDTSVRPEPQPWLADAMMQALDQYESLAKQRQRRDAADDRATAGNIP